MTPVERIDGMKCYYNDELGIELQAVPESYVFHEGQEYRVVEDLTWQKQHGWCVGADTLLDGHQVIMFDGNSYLGSVHEIHLTEE